MDHRLEFAAQHDGLDDTTLRRHVLRVERLIIFYPHRMSARSYRPPVSGVRFEFHTTPSGPSGATRTLSLQGPNTLNRPCSPEQRDGDVPTMSEFLCRDNRRGSRHPGDITGPMVAQYLLASLGHGPIGRGMDLTLGPEGGGLSGRCIFSQEAPLLDKDCAVCKEQFHLGTEDPEERVVVTLPCKHPFHQLCILISNGTCPVRRTGATATFTWQPPPPRDQEVTPQYPHNKPISTTTATSTIAWELRL
ncbi:hypothetical protein DFH29DRAFT_1043777 [Suillus ampliporus]|nr:hypothetical protein DFH29DRAFT_1043777 [Suillus ampliporus]